LRGAFTGERQRTEALHANQVRIEYAPRVRRMRIK